MKTTSILKEIRDRLTYRAVNKQISNSTFKTYMAIAKKILNDKNYLKKEFSRGHYRRIKVVLALIDKVMSIFKETRSGALYRVSGGFFSTELNKLFENFADFVIFKKRKAKADSFLKSFFSIFKNKNLNPFAV